MDLEFKVWIRTTDEKADSEHVCRLIKSILDNAAEDYKLGLREVAAIHVRDLQGDLTCA